jgi:ATP-binding cassette subfamily B protein
VALVGRTGAGKTSALHLLAGLYAPWHGRVSVAGRDPASLDERDRRRIVGVVPQAVQLFSGTVTENVTLGDPAIPEAAVYEACRIAGADPFIRTLPQGYDTVLKGSGRATGTRLSSGQQQLLALARALVGMPPALLFDEATASVDSATDAAFRAALRASVLSRGCGVLTVAHRLATALEADPPRQGTHPRGRPTRRARGERRPLRGAPRARGRRLGLAPEPVGEAVDPA